ncbi:MAG: PKD domain-containing protein [Bacteroidales bacterium]|nr:PKD domain-containing protein [Bacteroidales bacterium]
MKKLLLTFWMIALTLMGFAEYDATIYGMVSQDEEPVEGQLVNIISADSLENPINITVYTNEAGEYEATFTLNHGEGGKHFVVQTSDCNGQMLQETVVLFPWQPNAEVNFELCGGGGEECEASFIYDTFEDDPHTVYFEDTSEGEIEGWYWEFGDGTFCYAQNPVHFFETGTYEVCLTIEGEGCEDTYCEEITIGGGGGEECESWFEVVEMENLTVTLEAGSVAEHPIFFWHFGDETTGEGQEVTHTYPEEGWYEVTLVMEDSISQCTWEVEEEIYVGEEPGGDHELYGHVFAGDSYLDSGIALLLGFENSFYRLSLIGEEGMYYFEEVPNGTYYVLTMPSFTSQFAFQYLPTYYGNTFLWSNAEPIELGEPANPYNIQLVPINNMNLGDASIDGWITNGDSKGSVENITVLLMDNSGNPLDYDLTDSEGNFAFEELEYGDYLLYVEKVGVQCDPIPVSLSEDNPNVTIELIMQNGQIMVGLDEQPEFSAMGNLYPNPAKQQLNFEVDVKENINIKAAIYSSMGKLMFSSDKQLQAGSNQLQFNIKELPQGIYNLIITDSKGNSMNRKFVKMN